MAAPPISERHLPHFHRQAPMKEAVRAATTASITISTALNNGDSLDGLTLATGDRVLVKDQSTGSQNGIYTVGASPARDYDESTDDPSFGYLVYVREGTTNGGTLWKNTNTTAPTIGSTSLTFAQFTSTGLTDPMTTRGDIIIRDASNVTARLAHGSADTYLGSDGTDVAFSAVTDAKLSTSDITTNNASTSKHGFLKKLDNDSTHFMDGTGAWAVPAGSGSGTLTTVEEVDGSPTDSAVTKLVFPNGTLSITSHVATYTPSGGGGTTFPRVVQVKFAGTTISSLTLDSAPASGHTVLLYCDAFNTADPTAVSSTNTTWTKIKSVSAGAKYSLWVGVVAGGAGGTVITITHANSFLSAFAIEVTDTLSGTLGTSGSGPVLTTIATAAAPTTGNLVATFGGVDNTSVIDTGSVSLPTIGLNSGIVWGLVGYALGDTVYATMASSAGTLMIAEIT